ncbi:hypothetical protein C3495_08800 [Clostridiaceae bacterium 14S0207]|nr:hypothetical protein C3495_08800 [Clostridiaceae bacterium 14S0207]
MAYNVIDLLERKIDISNKILDLYKDTQNEYRSNKPLCLIINVFINYRNSKIEHCKLLKEDLKHKDLKDIDIFIYDKISSLISQFHSNMTGFSCNGEVKDFLERCIILNEEEKALIINIRGRLIQQYEDTNTIEYRVLTNIMVKEEKFIDELKKFKKKYI